MPSYKTNIEKVTNRNKKFRRILYTTKNMQLVIMRLKPKEEIGLEKHRGTQFIRVEKGKAKAIVGTKTMKLKAGDSVMIPPNTKHNVIATTSLHLYTLYSPPEH